ncbi:hypothetical protein [Streptomyces sp. CB01881]|uniref:hypothetical protein n=1 Tax=Streptomyces sp. CB01881 TaxID=2078691 RepID=UPI00138764A0|nr:hypothetical protein [Streptomyces sp. CB01881]
MIEFGSEGQPEVLVLVGGAGWDRHAGPGLVAPAVEDPGQQFGVDGVVLVLVDLERDVALAGEVDGAAGVVHAAAQRHEDCELVVDRHPAALAALEGDRA